MRYYTEKKDICLSILYFYNYCGMFPDFHLSLREMAKQEEMWFPWIGYGFEKWKKESLWASHSSPRAYPSQLSCKPEE